MKIKKTVQGKTVELEIKKIKSYSNYNLYQVYKIENNKKTPVYKECYTDEQIEEIITNNYWITEEVIS